MNKTAETSAGLSDQEKRTAIYLKNNSAYLEEIRVSLTGRLAFLTDRHLQKLYREYQAEKDLPRKLDRCAAALNRYDQSWIRKMRLTASILKEDIRLFFRQFGRRKTIDRSDKSMKDYYSIAVIVKNEARYMREYLVFHQAAGADRIYVYDNDSTDNLLEVLKPFLESGLAVYRQWPGQTVQTAAYRDALRRAKKRTKWLALIDADEFLFSPKGSMKEQLQAYEQYPGLIANWVMFGPNGHKKRPEGLIMDNYVTTQANSDAWINCHVKSIVQPGKVFTVTHTHFALYRHGDFAVDELGQPVDNRNAFVIRAGRAFTTHNHREIFRINHYATKSLEDLEEKCRRGYPDGSPPAKYEAQLAPFQEELTEDYVIKPLAEEVERRMRHLS